MSKLSYFGVVAVCYAVCTIIHFMARPQFPLENPCKKGCAYYNSYRYYMKQNRPIFFMKQLLWFFTTVLLGIAIGIQND